MATVKKEMEVLRRWIPQTYFSTTIYTRIPSAVNQEAIRPAEGVQRPSSGVNDNRTNFNLFCHDE